MEKHLYKIFQNLFCESRILFETPSSTPDGTQEVDATAVVNVDVPAPEEDLAEATSGTEAEATSAALADEVPDSELPEVPELSSEPEEKADDQQETVTEKTLDDTKNDLLKLCGVDPDQAPKCNKFFNLIIENNVDITINQFVIIINQPENKKEFALALLADKINETVEELKKLLKLYKSGENSEATEDQRQKIAEIISTISSDPQLRDMLQFKINSGTDSTKLEKKPNKSSKYYKAALRFRESVLFDSLSAQKQAQMEEFIADPGKFFDEHPEDYKGAEGLGNILLNLLRMEDILGEGFLNNGNLKNYPENFFVFDYILNGSPDDANSRFSSIDLTVKAEFGLDENGNVIIIGGSTSSTGGGNTGGSGGGSQTNVSPAVSSSVTQNVQNNPDVTQLGGPNVIVSGGTNVVNVGAEQKEAEPELPKDPVEKLNVLIQKTPPNWMDISICLAGEIAPINGNVLKLGNSVPPILGENTFLSFDNLVNYYTLPYSADMMKLLYAANGGKDLSESQIRNLIEKKGFWISPDALFSMFERQRDKQLFIVDLLKPNSTQFILALFLLPRFLDGTYKNDVLFYLLANNLNMTAKINEIGLKLDTAISKNDILLKDFTPEEILAYCKSKNDLYLPASKHLSTRPLEESKDTRRTFIDEIINYSDKFPELNDQIEFADQIVSEMKNGVIQIDELAEITRTRIEVTKPQLAICIYERLDSGEYTRKAFDLYEKAGDNIDIRISMKALWKIDDRDAIKVLSEKDNDGSNSTVYGSSRSFERGTDSADSDALKLFIYFRDGGFMRGEPINFEDNWQWGGSGTNDHEEDVEKDNNESNDMVNNVLNNLGVSWDYFLEHGDEFENVGKN